MGRVFTTIGILFLCACGPENVNFFGSAKQVEENPKVQNAQSIEIEDGETLKAAFEIASIEKEKLVDYMLIVDNSSSMTKVLENSNIGIQAVLNAQAFAENSRLAVMDSMPGDPAENLAKVHSTINDTYGNVNNKMHFEPGFLAPKSQPRLERAIEKNPLFDASKYTLALCETWFFSPYKKHADGHYCIEAALQSSLLPLGLEDGILALYHFLVRRADRITFRDGAEVHIVFISDVHAPGVPRNERWEPVFQNRPLTKDVLDAFNTGNNVSGVFFHSLAPERVTAGCTESEGNWSLGRTYYALSDETGGVKHDVCKVEGFIDFFDKMVKKSLEQTYKVKLDETPKKVISVTVNGTKASSFKNKGPEVEFNIGKINTEKLKVVVEYDLK